MSEYFRNFIKKEHYPVHPTNIKFKTTFKNCVLDALKKRNWKETEDDNWDIYWAEKEWIHEVMDHTHLNNNQRVNHFRNHYELTRKDLMIKNLKRHKKQLEKDGKLDEAASYNFFPQTFNLPNDYSIFFEEFKRTNQLNPNTIWIMKPIGKAQGKGIFLFNKIQQISNWKNSNKYNPDNPSAEPYIVQKYISDPLIIGGKKFDMRIYVLVVSYNPLTVYFYRTGFARFTHHRYDNEDINNTYVHLTNVAIQKTSENYDEKLGGKWDIQTLKLYLLSKYGQDKVSDCFNQIQTIVIKTLLSVQKVIINDKHCFELYGFDILLDKDLKSWILEVNASPSMTANTQIDYELKCNLLDDTFTVLDLEKVLTGQEEQIGGFDLIYKGMPVKLPSNSTFGSLLGANNNRSQQLKRLARSTALRLAQFLQISKESPQTPQSDLAIKNRINLQAKKSVILQQNPNKQNVIVGKNPTQNIQQIGIQQNILSGQNSNTSSLNGENNKNLITRGNTKKNSNNFKESQQQMTSIVNSNISIAQTTAFTQNVINNINNMQKNGRDRKNNQDEKSFTQKYYNAINTSKRLYGSEEQKQKMDYNQE